MTVTIHVDAMEERNGARCLPATKHPEASEAAVLAEILGS
jgi:hypothetical protein